MESEHQAEGKLTGRLSLVKASVSLGPVLVSIASTIRLGSSSGTLTFLTSVTPEPCVDDVMCLPWEGTAHGLSSWAKADEACVDDVMCTRGEDSTDYHLVD